MNNSDELSDAVLSELGNYVYELSDGTGPFYFGKGGGRNGNRSNDRVLHHQRIVSGMDHDAETQKKIKYAKENGSFQQRFVAWGLSERDALLIEAALIDANWPNLTNKYRGHTTFRGEKLAEFGLKVGDNRGFIANSVSDINSRLGYRPKLVSDLTFPGKGVILCVKLNYDPFELEKNGSLKQRVLEEWQIPAGCSPQITHVIAVGPGKQNTVAAGYQIIDRVERPRMRNTIRGIRTDCFYKFVADGRTSAEVLESLNLTKASLPELTFRAGRPKPLYLKEGKCYSRFPS